MKNTRKKTTSKQIVAIIGIVLLVLLYVVTLVLAFVDSAVTNTLFTICMFSTILVPALIWIYIWMYGKLTGKSTMADLQLGGAGPVADEGINSAASKQALTNQKTDTD